MSDTPEPTRIVIAEQSDEQLLWLRQEFEEMLTWGLSKQARYSIERKLGAVNYVIAERERKSQ